MQMRPLLLISLVLLVGSGCPSETFGSSHPLPPSTVAQDLPQDAAIVPAGCGATHLLKGYEPEWVTDGGAHNNPNFVPYAGGIPQTAAGFSFGYPLRAGHPTDRAN